MNDDIPPLSRARLRILRLLQPARRLRYQSSRWLKRKIAGGPGVEPAPLLRANLPGVRIVKTIRAEAGTVELPLPAQPDGRTHPFFRTRRTIPVFARCLARLNGARIHGPDGFLYLPDGRVLLENHFFFRDHVENHDLYFARLPESRRLDGPVFPLIGFCPGAHYHWMTEVLYRLHGCLEELPAETRFLVPAHTSPVHLEALRAFGIGEDRLLPMEQDDHFEFSDLWYASPVTSSGYDLPEISRWVRAVLVRHASPRLGPRAGEAPERIYITRRLASKRRVSNEAGLLAVLSSAGVACVECERLSFLEQAAAFSRAKIVIAPHGAGLVNLLFAPGGGQLLEMYPEEIPMGATCYWSLAHALGWSYHYLRGSRPARAADCSDISVAVDEVGKWLQGTSRGAPAA